MTFFSHSPATFVTMSSPVPEKKTPFNGSKTTALRTTVRTARQLFILTIGMTVVLLGVVMIVLPAPSFLVILGGLAILGIEFAWARRWLTKFKSFLPKRKSPAAATLPPPAPSSPEFGPSAPLASSAETPVMAPPAA